MKKEEKEMKTDNLCSEVYGNGRAFSKWGWLND